MHDIKRLEESWVKYRNKRRKPYYIIIFLLSALGVALYVLYKSHIASSFTKYTNSTEKVKQHTLNNVASQTEKPSIKPFLCNKPILTIQHIKRPPKKAPLIPMTERINTPAVPVVKDIPIIEEKEIEEIESRKKVLKSKKEKKRKVIQEDNKKHLKITKVSNQRAYKEVAKRFYQFHDVDDALFLARVYYRNGAYKKAEKWALKTNKLNNTLEESWIIFAKSKIKLGHITEAKHILSNYIKKTNSQKAKILLYKINK